jgi:hypothetical protein
MKNDRFLLGILIGIILIVLLSIGIVIFNPQGSNYLPENSPEAVVNNYLTAWAQEDFDKVAGYLMEAENKPEFHKIIQTAYETKYATDTTSVRIDKSILRDHEATVILTMISHPGDPFSTTSQTSGLVALIKENDAWKIKQFPYPFWGWDWYESQSITTK